MRTALIAGTFVVAFLVFVNFWTFRPTQTMQEFVRRAVTGRLMEAAQMVSLPSKINTASSTHTIIAIDGTSCVLPIGKAELHVLEEPKRRPRDGISDYLLCRQRFQLCAFWSDENGVSKVAPIYCTTKGTKVEIDHVGVSK